MLVSGNATATEAVRREVVAVLQAGAAGPSEADGQLELYLQVGVGRGGGTRPRVLVLVQMSAYRTRAPIMPARSVMLRCLHRPTGAVRAARCAGALGQGRLAGGRRLRQHSGGSPGARG